MENKKYELSEEITYIKKQIESSQTKLKKMEESQSSETSMKTTKLSIVDLERELLEKEKELRFEQLEEMKQSLKDRRDEKLIDEITYQEDLRDIDKYDNAITEFYDMQSMRLDYETLEINESKTDFLQKKEENLKEKEADFNKAMAKFLKSFTLHRRDEGEMTTDERKEILAQESFGIDDIEKYFSELSDTVYDVQKQTSNNMSIDLAKETLPKNDIENISCIDDYVTKQQLCQLYQVQDPEDIEIFAIHSFDNTTIGEISGMSRDAYEKTLGDDYDKAIGEKVGLYCFNKKSGKLEMLQNGEPTECVSKGQNIDVSHAGAVNSETEIATMSYSGLKLTFYTNENGKMCIARNMDGKLSEISTQTLEEMETVKNMQERINGIVQGETEVVAARESQVPDVSNDVRNADEMHDKMHKFFEHMADVKKQLEENERRTTLEEKETAGRQEKLDRERLDSKRRLI